MNNRELSIPLFVTDVRTSGNKGNLAPGQMIVVDLGKTENGSLAYASNLNQPKHKKSFRIDVGATKRLKSRSSQQGDKTTPNFALEDIRELKITYPVSNEFEVDEWIIGFNGGNDTSTSLDFRSSDEAFVISMDLMDGSIPFSGGSTNKERVTIFQPISDILPWDTCTTTPDSCEVVPCKDIVIELIERMRKHQISGGRELQELIEITPIFSCDQEVGEDEVTFWTISVCDLGDLKSLADIQSKTATPVVRINRNGAVSTYQTMVLAGVTPPNVTITPSSIMADCDECPDDYTLEAGGFVYTYTKIDTSNSPSTITIPGQVSGTNILQGRNGDFVTFTVKTTSVLTSSQIATLISANATMTIDLIGEVATICNKDGYDLEWIEGDTCQSTNRQFRIDLPDTRCGENRLIELQSAYPEYAVTLDPNSSVSTYTVNFSGSSGTGNLTINGVDYLATFNTDLTTTALDFVVLHTNAINALGGTITLNISEITITIPTSLGAITYENLTGDLGATIVNTENNAEGEGCRNQYLITVPTNIVCEECSPVFKDFYSAETPRPFMEYEWVPYGLPTPSTGCSCGIRIRGKRFVINPDSCIEGRINFIEDSVGIKLDAGYTKTMSGFVDLYTAGVDYKAVHKEQTFRKKNRDMLGGNLKHVEMQSEMHFTNSPFPYDNVEKAMLGKESLITDNFDQYAMFSLIISPAKFTQSLAHFNRNEYQSYDFYVPLGKHSSVEGELKRLAAAAGAPIVDAQP